MSTRQRRRAGRLKTGNEGWLTSYADLITNLLIFFVLIIAASEIQTGKLEQIANQISQKKTTAGSLTHAKEVLEQAIRDQNLQKEVNVAMTSDGLELSFNSGLTFESGSSDILAAMVRPLQKVLTPLVPLADKYRFAVEGHTDQMPINQTSSHFKSNWELSSARSLAVREHLETIGVPRDRIRVEAYADTRPLAAEQLKGLTVEETLARHRRVVVRVY